MSGCLQFFPGSKFEARFCVVGWTAAESDAHEVKMKELGDYAVAAANMGLDHSEIALDILEAGAALFQKVEVALVPMSRGMTAVSIVAIAAEMAGAVGRVAHEEVRRRA